MIIITFRKTSKPITHSPGPSYKRGPPKGYIHAIEQHWRQVESLLGAILQCQDTRVQEFVNDLKQDDLAREIIDRVDMGPYVSSFSGILLVNSVGLRSGSGRSTDPTSWCYKRRFFRIKFQLQ